MAIEHKDIAAIREDYSKGSLDENDILSDPLDQFKVWLAQALDAKVMEPNAMVLSTINVDGFPSSRVVLLKDVKAVGFSFFTNYESQKGHDISKDNKVSLLFFWPELQRQIRIEGLVEKVEVEDSDEYFASRPRGSQIGAWSSPQSHVLVNRASLEKAVEANEKKFKEEESVPRPDFWGGFMVKPHRFEYWQGRSSRLHDRIVFEKKSTTWKIYRIAP